MKSAKKLMWVLAFLFVLGLGNGFAQRNHRGNRHANGFHHRNQRIYPRSQYRPVKIRYFRPAWSQQRFNRRWVYFPHYNFYWDNWRQMYVYQNNAVWIVNATPPPTIVNVNIENENHYELDEKEDDVDNIYENNGAPKDSTAK